MFFKNNLISNINSRASLLQTFFNLHISPVRTCQELPEGMNYYGFTYYPRHKDFKDPPYNPSKLFLIKRIKPVKGTTKEEKQILESLNIHGKPKNRGHLNVVKNIPSVNADLWKVKHLIEIKPITCKGPLPKDGDFFGTFLRETGELVVSPKLKPTSEELEISETFGKKCNKLQRLYLREYLKKKWLNGFEGKV